MKRIGSYWSLVLFALGAVVLVPDCVIKATTTGDCVAGSTEFCTCSGGGSGERTCNSAGNGFSACICGPSTSSSSTSTSATGSSTTGSATVGATRNVSSADSPSPIVALHAATFPGVLKPAVRQGPCGRQSPRTVNGRTVRKRSPGG